MDDIQDGNPAVIGKPLRPVALRPLLSKGVPFADRGQGALRGCSCLRITSHFERQRYVNHESYAADSALKVLQLFRHAVMAVGGRSSAQEPDRYLRLSSAFSSGRRTV